MIAKWLCKELTEIRDIAKMEHAHFGSHVKYPIVLRDVDEVNMFVKSNIKLWLDTWIVARLDRILTETK